MPGFQSFFQVFCIFVLAKLATNSIRTQHMLNQTSVSAGNVYLCEREKVGSGQVI